MGYNGHYSIRDVTWESVEIIVQRLKNYAADTRTAFGRSVGWLLSEYRDPKNLQKERRTRIFVVCKLDKGWVYGRRCDYCFIYKNTIYELMVKNGSFWARYITRTRHFGPWHKFNRMRDLQENMDVLGYNYNRFQEK